jgi:CDP-diacylglycerol--glycerol-3-phosphate 3-phosphatidyltransferase
MEFNRLNAGSVLYRDLGWANRLTIFRGLLIAMTGGFILHPWPPAILAWMPGILYTAAAIIDRVDGYVARKTSRQSLLGTELDTVLDALGLAVAPLLAVWYGQIHWSYLAVSVAHYLFQWGIYHRKKNGLPVYPLPPTFSRRAIAGVQMGFIAVVLWPIYQPPATTVAGFVFMVPVLTGFVIDWLTVSGVIHRDRGYAAESIRKFGQISVMFIQPALRLLITALVCAVLFRTGDTHYDFGLITLLIVGGMILTTILVLIGFMGRFAGILLVVLLGLYYRSTQLFIIDVILLASVIWVISFGTGRYSIWQWDEDWINRYDGT